MIPYEEKLFEDWYAKEFPKWNKVNYLFAKKVWLAGWSAAKQDSVEDEAGASL